MMDYLEYLSAWMSELHNPREADTDRWRMVAEGIRKSVLRSAFSAITKPDERLRRVGMMLKFHMGPEGNISDGVN